MKKGRNVHEWVKLFWIYFVSFLAFTGLFFLALSAGWLGYMPSLEELENPKSNLASEVISADQQVLGTIYIENRTISHYNELSPYLVNALIATEDVRFIKHSGVDTRALLRAMFGMVTNTGMGGGSTITQQLAKNLFPRNTHFSILGTGFAKLKEWVMAIKLERNYTKEEILALYLNTVDFGNQAFGIKAAAKTYFNKLPSELNIQESAILIGMLKAPTKFNPVRNNDKAMKRREVVLHQMLKNNFITQQQYDATRLSPIDVTRFHVQDHNTGPGTYFREFIKQMLMADEPQENDFDDPAMYKIAKNQWANNPAYGWANKNHKSDGSKYSLYKDGLKIYTTVNSKMQQYAEEAVAEHMGKYLQPTFYKHWKGRANAPFDLSDKNDIARSMESAKHRSDRFKSMVAEGISRDSIDRVFHIPTPMRVFSWKGERDTVMSPMDSIRYYKFFLQTGLMSMEPQTGYVRAYVGGINFKHFKYDHVSQGRRQVGSTFKPFVYTVAMQSGEFSPCTQVANVQYSVGDWAPKNSGHYKEGEMVTLKEALAHSINWISTYLIKRFSPSTVIKIARKMGVNSPIDPVPSICLGSCDLTLSEMVGAMDTYANKGMYIQPIFVTRIEDRHGNILAEFTTRQEEAMSEETAYLMISLMKGVVETGTGTRIRSAYGLRNPIAGKTGTSQNQSDGWFMGLTPDLVTGIWVGGEDRSIRFTDMSLGQGANMALPIWGIYMKKIYADNTLQISKGDFERPSEPLSVTLDCAAESTPADQNNNEGDY